jgi:hypothetical protein
VLEVARAQWSLEHLGDLAGPTAQTPSETPGWARRFLAAPLDPARTQALTAQLAEIGVWVVPTSVEKDRSLAPPATVEGWLADPAMRDLPAGALGTWRGMMRGFSGRLGADDWPMVEQARRNRIELIRLLHTNGVRLVVGSDTPNMFVVPGQSVHLELANFVAAGFTPGEALEAATAAPARMLGPLSDAGSIEVGKRADLLLLTADPFEDVGNLQRRAGLVVNGRWLDEAALVRARGDLAR